MDDITQYIHDIVDLHRTAHTRLREQIAGLDAAALNWVPAPDANSIGTIVVHTLGAEAEILRTVLAIPTQRVRAEEFAEREYQLADLERLLDAAEADWNELAVRLDEAALRAVVTHPQRKIDQTGLYWLVRNFGHMSEHLAHVELTRQLYAAQA